MEIIGANYQLDRSEKTNINTILRNNAGSNGIIDSPAERNAIVKAVCKLVRAYSAEFTPIRNYVERALTHIFNNIIQQNPALRSGLNEIKQEILSDIDSYKEIFVQRC